MIESDSDRTLLQRDLSALEQWEQTWQMSFNPAKCVLMRISTKKNKKVLHTQYQLHGHTLDVYDISKYLGVTIKVDLSWDAHVQNIVAKANRTVGFLRRNLKDCKPQVKDVAYKTMVRPILEYASPVWDPHTQANIKSLEQVQRRAARFVSSDYQSRTPGCVTKMLDDIKWEPLKDRRRLDRLSMLYRMQHCLII